jgi:hypothetical protein
MADNKGIYFGGGNRGLATILDSGETERTRQRLSMDEQRKIAQQVADKERRDKQAEQLKNFDAWRVYQPALQKKYDDIANRLKKGELDPFTLRQELNDYAGKAQASMQLQDEWKQASADYEKNKKVLGNAADWYIQSYHGDPSVDNLTKISSSPLNRYGFVDEKGGSQYINPTESFNDVITKSLGNWVESEVQNAVGKGQVVARGLMQFKSQHDTSKLKSFSEVDPKTGKIQVKDVDALIESGVLDLFESDPYTNRVLEDETDRIIGKSEVSPEDRERLKTQILRNYLQPYGSSGKVTTETKATQQSFKVFQPTGGGSAADDKDKAQRIYDVFSSRSVGEGQDVGETKKYTKKMLMDRGYSEQIADLLVKKGATYMESKALKGWKNEAGEVLGNIYWSEYNDKDFPQRIAKIDVYKPDSDKPEKRTLSLNELQSFIPISVYKEVEQIARDQGRLNASGNFIYRPNSNYNQKTKK